MKKYTLDELINIFEQGKQNTLPEYLYQHTRRALPCGDSWESDFFESEEECRADMEADINMLTMRERKKNKFFLRPLKVDWVKLDDLVNGWY